VERHTWLRSVYFVLGTLSGVNKLLAFQDTPRSQVTGLSFLISFVVVELIIIFVLGTPGGIDWILDETSNWGLE